MGGAGTRRSLKGVLVRAERLLVRAGVVAASRDAELLLEQASGLTRARLIARSDEELDSEALARFARLVKARARRQPLQYILGEWEFYGRSFELTPDVLIPRPETEHLVEAALARLGPAGRVADVGTGSGAIAVTLAAERPGLELWALDVSEPALRVAGRNAARHGVSERVRIAAGHLLEPLAGWVAEGTLDAVVSNPPYIALGERERLAPEVRDHEPALALYAGTSGLETLCELIAQAPRWLRPGGFLALEIGHGQSGGVEQAAAATGEWGDLVWRFDLAGHARVAVLARR